MDANRLNDVLNRGMGNAARVIGEDYDLFRPVGFRQPLTSANWLMRLPVLLHDTIRAGRSLGGGSETPIEATFDGISARVGDYLRGPRGVLFICALPPMGRPSCMLTNRAVDVLRVNRAASGGLGSYGGVTEQVLDMILEDWPVQFRLASGGKAGRLPADGGQSAALVAFPRTPVSIQASDLLQDATGGRFVVQSADETEAGWRLSVRGTEV